MALPTDLSFDDGISCLNCLVVHPLGGADLKLCGGCHMVRYCTDECQKENWRHHKSSCKIHQAQITDPADKKLQKVIGRWYGRNEESIKVAALQALLPRQGERSPNIIGNILVITLAENPNALDLTGARVGSMDEMRAPFVKFNQDHEAFVAQEKEQSERLAVRRSKPSSGTVFVMIVCKSLVCVVAQPLWTEDKEELTKQPRDTRWLDLLRKKVDMQKMLYGMLDM